MSASEPKTFLIFAHAYNCYWRPNRCGYGPLLSAGLYTEADARAQEKTRPLVDRAQSLADALRSLHTDINPEIVAAIAAQVLTDRNAGGGA